MGKAIGSWRFQSPWNHIDLKISRQHFLYTTFLTALLFIKGVMLWKHLNTYTILLILNNNHHKICRLSQSLKNTWAWPNVWKKHAELIKLYVLLPPQSNVCISTATFGLPSKNLNSFWYSRRDSWCIRTEIVKYINMDLYSIVISILRRFSWPWFVINRRWCFKC